MSGIIQDFYDFFNLSALFNNADMTIIELFSGIVTVFVSLAFVLVMLGFVMNFVKILMDWRNFR